MATSQGGIVGDDVSEERAAGTQGSGRLGVAGVMRDDSNNIVH